MKKVLLSLFLGLFLTLSSYAHIVKVVNYSDRPITGVYAARSSQQDWTGNLLGGVVIYYNEYYNFNTNYTDYYDFAIFDSSGDECRLKRVLMNRSKVLTVSNSGCVIR